MIIQAKIVQICHTCPKSRVLYTSNQARNSLQLQWKKASRFQIVSAISLNSANQMSLKQIQLISESSGSIRISTRLRLKKIISTKLMARILTLSSIQMNYSTHFRSTSHLQCLTLWRLKKIQQNRLYSTQKKLSFLTRCQTWSSPILSKDLQKLWWKKHLTTWQVRMNILKINLLKQKNYLIFTRNFLMTHSRIRPALYRHAKRVERIWIVRWMNKPNTFRETRCCWDHHRLAWCRQWSKKMTSTKAEKWTKSIR